MARNGNSKGRMRLAPALLAAAGVVLALPVASFAFGSADNGDSVKAALRAADVGYMPFTPAKIDPKLARQVEAIIGADGLRFTPASNSARKDRTVTVAVRVDDATARALSIRTAMEPTSADSGRAAVLTLAPSRYNLGIARGYQSFAQPVAKPAAISVGLRDMKMPDLGEFRSEGGTQSAKPSRFQPRIALEQDASVGRTPRTFQGLGEQSVDVGGSYRLGRNLNVTAGVRLLQQRDRLAPMTDGEEDSQAVYVGTQIRF